MVVAMSELSRTLTEDEIRDRMRAAGLHIAEARLEMVRALLNTALAPVLATDSRALRTIEPAVAFDVGAGHGDR
jgi:hypothetical protein